MRTITQYDIRDEITFQNEKLNYKWSIKDRMLNELLMVMRTLKSDVIDKLYLREIKSNKNQMKVN